MVLRTVIFRKRVDNTPRFFDDRTTKEVFHGTRNVFDAKKGKWVTVDISRYRDTAKKTSIHPAPRKYLPDYRKNVAKRILNGKFDKVA